MATAADRSSAATEDTHHGPRPTGRRDTLRVRRVSDGRSVIPVRPAMPDWTRISDGSAGRRPARTKRGRRRVWTPIRQGQQCAGSPPPAYVDGLFDLSIGAPCYGLKGIF